MTMTLKLSSREKHKELNTLSCVVTGLVGWRTTVELHNDAFVVGKIISADVMMNIEMINARYTDGNGNSYYLDNFFIKGRKIRYVHIPEQIDALKLIESKVIIQPKTTRPPTLKQMKMRKRDIQTLKRYHREREEEGH